MKIHDIEIGILKTPLKRPFKTALRTAYFTEDIVIKIFADNGLIGYGSCAPIPQITGETLGSLLHMLGHIKEKILNVEFFALEKILHIAESGFVHNRAALAGIDMALHDLYCQFLKLPLYKYLGGERNTLFTSMTISFNDINTMIADALLAVAEGFCELKIKVGIDPQHDFERILAISQAVGSHIKLRIDANQGWKPKEAIRIIRKFEENNLNIEFVEQPLKADDFLGLISVQKNVKTDILADESVFSPQDALKIVQAQAADLINIKLAKAGGLLGATKIYHIAQAAEVECVIGCMLESHVAVSAAAHFAAAKKSITRCDLDASFLVLKNPVESSVTLKGNGLIIDEKSYGLGIKHIHGYELIK